MPGSLRKVAFLCDRVGPYHLARLTELSRKYMVHVVEFSEHDRVYAWDSVAPNGTFSKTVLFSDGPAEERPVKEIIKRVDEVLDRVAPDLVAIPGWDPKVSIVALRWCLRRDVPTVLMADSHERVTARSKWKELIKKKIVKLYGSAFVAGIPHVSYLKKLGMDEERITCGVDVVDNKFFELGALREKQSKEITERLQLPEKFFLASSRFIPKKNINFLISAYAEYRRQSAGIPWNLVLLGDGELKEDIVRLVKSKGLTKFVRMPGFRQYDELPAYYGAASAFVHASTSEEWGLVVNEAMAAGLPVIVSRACGCVEDLVQPGLNGYTFDASCLSELAGCFKILAEREELIESLGCESRKIVSYWGLERFVAGFSEAANIAKRTLPPKVPLSTRLLLNTLIYWRRS